MIAQTFDEWWIPFTPAQQGHGYHEPSYRSIAQASWQARDAEVAELQAKLTEVEAELNTQRTQTLRYYGQVKKLAAALTESQRLNKVALEAMKLALIQIADFTIHEAINNAIKEIEGGKK